VKVLHLAAGNLYGGVETFLKTLAEYRQLCPEMEPHFGLCFRGQLWDELTAANVPLYDLGNVRLSRPWTMMKARWRLKRVLQNNQFDAAIVNGSWPHVIFAQCIKKTNVKLVHMVHGEIDRKHWLNRWATQTQPNLVIANSHYIAGTITSVFANCPIATVYCPVPAPEIGDAASVRKEVRKSLETEDDKVVILQVSRLELWKGQAVHLAALGRLKEQSNWEAWFVGGPQKPGESEFLNELKDSAKRYGIDDRVKFLGQRSDVPRLMAAADIYCQPNIGPEPFGIVFVEALYAGLPVIASSEGGACEIITAECGRLVKPHDAIGLSSTLAKIIVDSALRMSIVHQSVARARKLCDPAKQLLRLSRVIAS
jgi:glycosyltransferase involved in cell wall biosynthesis